MPGLIGKDWKRARMGGVVRKGWGGRELYLKNGLKAVEVETIIVCIYSNYIVCR